MKLFIVALAYFKNNIVGARKFISINMGESDEYEVVTYHYGNFTRVTFDRVLHFLVSFTPSSAAEDVGTT